MRNTLEAVRLRNRSIAEKRESGFTLVEILAAVVIIGILATLAILKIISVINNSRDTAAKDEVSSVRKAEAIYFSGAGGGTQPSTYGTTAELAAESTVNYSPSTSVTSVTVTKSGSGATADCSIVVVSKTGATFTGSCNASAITQS